MIGAEGDSPRRAVLTLVGNVDLTVAPVLWERLVLEIGFGVQRNRCRHGRGDIP